MCRVGVPCKRLKNNTGALTVLPDDAGFVEAKYDVLVHY